MKQSNLWIGGQHVEPSGEDYFDDINPSDQSVIAKVAKGSASDIDKLSALPRKRSERLAGHKPKRGKKFFVMLLR